MELLPSAAGLPVSPANSNQAVLGVAQLAASGLDALQIEAGNAVQLSGNLALALNRQLIIDAPIIAATGGSSVSLGAPSRGRIQHDNTGGERQHRDRQFGRTEFPRQ